MIREFGSKLSNCEFIVIMTSLCSAFATLSHSQQTQRNRQQRRDAADREHIASGVSPRTVDAYARVTFDFERTLEI